MPQPTNSNRFIFFVAVQEISRYEDPEAYQSTVTCLKEKGSLLCCSFAYVVLSTTVVAPLANSGLVEMLDFTAGILFSTTRTPCTSNGETKGGVPFLAFVLDYRTEITTIRL